MNLFVIAAIVLTALAVAVVVRPLLRKTGDRLAAPVAALVLGLALPVGVLVIYLSASNHDWSMPAADAASAKDGSGGGGGLGSIAEMGAKLEERLRTEPENVDGWLLLGRTYAQLQQFADSGRAYRRALALEPGIAAKLGVAEADILLDRDNLMRDAGRLVEEVLAVEPQNPKALFYGGMVAMTRHDVEMFRDRWQRLLAMSPPDNIRAVIESQLAQENVVSGQINTTAQGIDVNVAIAAELAERVRPGAVLFLVARDPERPGPPLAAVRRAASELPVTLNISDSNAMIPGRPLLSLPRVQLIARITNSGEPVAQPGDLFGETAWIAGQSTGEGISIIIDQVAD